MNAETDPDPGWVAHLTGRSRPAADRAIAAAARETRLFRHLSRAHASEGRRSYVEIDAPLELYALVRLRRPRQVVEVGVSSGVSSAYLLQALARNGRGTLHSIDRPSRPRNPSTTASWSLPEGRCSGWAVPRGLTDGWDLRIGDKRDLVPVLADELARVDLFVYDVPHDCDASWGEFRCLDPVMPKGSIAIVDHGPGGGMCPALRRWARRRGGFPTVRSGLGLYGACLGSPTPPRSATEGAASPSLASPGGRAEATG